MQNSQILGPNFGNARHGNTESFPMERNCGLKLKEDTVQSVSFLAKIFCDVWGYSTQS